MYHILRYQPSSHVMGKSEIKSPRSRNIQDLGQGVSWSELACFLPRLVRLILPETRPSLKVRLFSERTNADFPLTRQSFAVERLRGAERSQVLPILEPESSPQQFNICVAPFAYTCSSWIRYTRCGRGLTCAKAGNRVSRLHRQRTF
jgi:hypothetical protein